MTHTTSPAAISTPPPIVSNGYHIAGPVNIALDVIDGGVMLQCQQGVARINGHWNPGDKGKTGYLSIHVFCVGEKSEKSVIIR